jgi:CRISPR-associated protein Cmr6
MEVEEETIDRIFGPRDSDISRVGSVIFLDAIPMEQVQLKADVMTPSLWPLLSGR